MSHTPLTDRTIWITGASSGIGRTLSEKLIHRGNRVVVTARSEDSLNELKQLAPERVFVVTADIADPDCTAPMTRELSEAVPYIDTAILNAGTCEYLDAQKYDTALVDRVIQVNLLGMSRCIEACLPLLRASSNQPHLVGVSSAAAITGLPRAEAYGASKAGVVSFLESLGLDLARENILVSIIYPGFVDTPLTQRNDFPMPFIMDADKAVDHMIRGIEKRKLKIQFPLPLILTLKLMSMLPESLRHRLGVGMAREDNSTKGNGA